MAVDRIRLPLALSIIGHAVVLALLILFFAETHPSPINPLGAKGAGEGGVVPVGGVIANAVASALTPLNVQLRELPLSPPRIWQAIEAAREAQSWRSAQSQ